MKDQQNMHIRLIMLNTSTVETPRNSSCLSCIMHRRNDTHCGTPELGWGWLCIICDRWSYIDIMKYIPYDICSCMACLQLMIILSVKVKFIAFSWTMVLSYLCTRFVQVWPMTCVTNAANIAIERLFCVYFIHYLGRDIISEWFYLSRMQPPSLSMGLQSWDIRHRTWHILHHYPSFLCNWNTEIQSLGDNCWDIYFLYTYM